MQFGGQTAIGLAAPLAADGVPILGTSVESIDLAEDRRRFDALMERAGRAASARGGGADGGGGDGDRR